MNKVSQKQIIDRMIKLTPPMDQLCELFADQGYWHRWDSKVTENHIKTKCGDIVKKLPNLENYRCEDFKKIMNLELCPTCLEVWSQEIEKNFEYNQIEKKLTELFNTAVEHFQDEFIEVGVDMTNQAIHQAIDLAGFPPVEDKFWEKLIQLPIKAPQTVEQIKYSYKFMINGNAYHQALYYRLLDCVDNENLKNWHYELDDWKTTIKQIYVDAIAEFVKNLGEINIDTHIERVLEICQAKD